jgi:hypothetical protein
LRSRPLPRPELRAFYSRQQPKRRLRHSLPLLHYDGGTHATVTAFAEEVDLGNPACPDALQTLHEHFANENAPGPVKSSHFALEPTTPGETADTRFLRASTRQDTVNAAQLLLKALQQRRESSKTKGLGERALAG